MQFAKKSVCALGLLFLNCSTVAYPEEKIAEPQTSRKEQVEKKDSEFERVGGTFVVTSIKRISEGQFKIIFTAKDGEPRFKTLILESPHVHVAVEEGKELRLSAEIISAKGRTAEVSQMVLFIPGRVGHTPVWLLSKHAVKSAAPAKLLEMHAPSTDYQVL